MIKITTKKYNKEDYYDFTLVCGDTAYITVNPYVIESGQKVQYEMQEGDKIRLSITKELGSTPLVMVIADENNTVHIDGEHSQLLETGDYYADATLEYADGNRDTFIQIPVSHGKAITNFHVIFGV